jgi:hypothetical protein
MKASILICLALASAISAAPELSIDRTTMTRFEPTSNEESVESYPSSDRWYYGWSSPSYYDPYLTNVKLKDKKSFLEFNCLNACVVFPQKIENFKKISL